jgi:hypothetical protein
VVDWGVSGSESEEQEVSDILEMGLAMSLLVNYAKTHDCSCWLEIKGNCRWHARIADYSPDGYDGGGWGASPVEAATNAIVNAGMHKLSVEEPKRVHLEKEDEV